MATPRPRDENTSPASEARMLLQTAKPLTWFDGIRQFFHEVALEMKKVSWPGRQEVVGTTIVVIVAVFFFGLYLGLVDYILAMGLDRVLRYFRVTGGA